MAVFSNAKFTIWNKAQKKNQGNVAQSKGQNKSLETNHQGMEICELFKQFKIIVFKKFNILQENTDRQLNEIKINKTWVKWEHEQGYRNYQSTEKIFWSRRIQ